MSATKDLKRPSVYDAIDKRQVMALAKAGHSDKFMCEFFGISLPLWKEWKISHPDFNRALKTWKDEADLVVEKALYHKAKGFQHDEEKIFCTKDGEIVRAKTKKQYAPDTAAISLWLKNRKPDDWADKQEVKHTGSVDHNHEHKVDKVDLDERIKQLAGEALDDRLKNVLS
jgi:hypothetical protein